MDAAMIIHLNENSSFEEWEQLMLGAYDNQQEVDDGKIIYGKAGARKAVLLRFDFDPAEMAARMGDTEFQKMIAGIVDRHEPFMLSPMPRPE